MCVYWANELSDPYTAIGLAEYVSIREQVSARTTGTPGLTDNLAGACRAAGDLARPSPLRGDPDRPERVLGPTTRTPGLTEQPRLRLPVGR